MSSRKPKPKHDNRTHHRRRHHPQHQSLRNRPRCDIADALSEVNALAVDYDNTPENDGDEDVWGTTATGGEFRIRIAIIED